MKGTRLPPDWSPDPNLLAWSKGRRPDLDMTDTIESFRDYWISKTGQGATKLDWNAAFRNWVRRAWVAPEKGFRKQQSESPRVPNRGPQRNMSDSEREKNLATHLPDLFKRLGIR